MTEHMAPLDSIDAARRACFEALRLTGFASLCPHHTGVLVGQGGSVNHIYRHVELGLAAGTIYADYKLTCDLILSASHHVYRECPTCQQLIAGGKTALRAV